MLTPPTTQDPTPNTQNLTPDGGCTVGTEPEIPRQAQFVFRRRGIVQTLLAPTARSGLTSQTSALVHAIVQTVAYADVFDYPLTTDEVHRYLIGRAASRGTVRGLLSNGQLPAKLLTRQGRYFTLAGREQAIDT